MRNKRITHTSKSKEKTKIAGVPPRNTSQHSTTVLGRKIIEVRESCGLLNNELCELLSSELETEKSISAATLHKWITKEPLKTRMFSEAQIIQALDSLKMKYGTEGYSTWVDGKEVGNKIAEWLKLLTKTVIAKEIGISRQLLEAWSKGNTRIARKRWTKVLDIMNKVKTKRETKPGLESQVLKKNIQKPLRDDRCGYKLISWIENIAVSKGLDSKATAEALGITYGYWMSLKDGFSKDSVISRRFAEACANFLNAPVLSVFIASGSIRLSDFSLPTENLLNEIDKAIEFIEKDPDYSAFVSDNIRTIDYSLKYVLIVLYERATKRKLLPARLDVNVFKNSFKNKNY